ncbi:uncharacterized protein N7503_005114 [Penicillium pulvis]|uniref:uncharacterized protein n=1 Tax=Penicillium pulvis TaxID=1562058 RepID=UPI002548B7BA|nr:uncharacterized protein N7503_005114 [Penicillium pulvis]KAJ5802664.1 hypothetical protein N7503_005114 [Penicillium pulvis]
MKPTTGTQQRGASNTRMRKQPVPALQDLTVSKVCDGRDTEMESAGSEWEECDKGGLKESETSG